MTLESAVASKSNLVDLDTHNIFGNTGQLSAIPHNTSHYQMTAMKSFNSTAEKQTGNSRWHIRTILDVSF